MPPFLLSIGFLILDLGLSCEQEILTAMTMQMPLFFKERTSELILVLS